MAYKDLVHAETPYVVMFQQVCELASPKPLWTFNHPNKDQVPEDGNPVNNLHNCRFSKATFEVETDMVMHGFAGYFESVLYKDVMISINPATHSPDMFSWFPIFFPIRQPVQAPKGSTITANFWRLTNEKKTWYEWTVSVCGKDGTHLCDLPIHNVAGRSYWVGL
jgi:protein arginine N-methyltransferase 5